MHRRQRVFAGVVIVLLLLSGGTTLWMATCGLAGCPSIEQLRGFRPSEGSRVLDRNGAPLGRLAYVRRINVPLDRVPRHVRAAFIAAEDRRFFYHGGIDWRSAGRALAHNLRAFAVREGFSTITMQVVRSAFLPHLSQERSLRRKLIEIELARRLEQALPKQRILEHYLNVIYLGNGTYGVEAASRDLFGKSVGRLTVGEAALLAGLARGPSIYSPRRHPDRARGRRGVVLAQMTREGFLSAERAAKAGREPFRLAATGWKPRRDPSQALDPVRTVVDSILGDEVEIAGDVVVHTTLDARAQRAAERAVSDRAAAIERVAPSWQRQGEELQGALVALDPRNGEIRALVGARRAVRRGFNRAFGARRQPGSAFKPFVYAAALADGYTPASLVDDSPVEVTDGSRVWRPVNFGGEYAGAVTLRRALMASANAATVRLSRAVGERRVAALARKAGLQGELDPVPSLALGAIEVTPLELIAAYAPFANGGHRVEPSLVRRIELADGTVLWRAPERTPQRVMGEAEAFQITSMLRSVVDGGTGHLVRELGVRGPVAGKTGTTNRGADIWFVGYTPTVAAVVWFGYDAPREIAPNASGGRLATPAWVAFYRNGWKEKAAASAWEPPVGLVSRTIDAYTGDIANEWCPTTQREWFKPGTEPVRICLTHDAPLIRRLEKFGRGLGEALKDLFGL
ncbi:MAG TPA: PBP1A family penicillin-binding protein [Gemmatimonadales bacterium]|nr:PBP1A family penicillin-binding protein [Gemmatimonadales bacterium]